MKLLKIAQIKRHQLFISMFILSIVPALLTSILIVIYCVNFPYWDQWAIASLFQKIDLGTLELSDLLAQHNESRKFFPRLLFIALAFITGWDVRYEMLVIFSLACLVSLNIYIISCMTLETNKVNSLLFLFFANLLIFSPIQWENWLWGIQVVVFVPIVSITSCLVIWYSEIKTIFKFIISLFLCTVSTFSYANGLLSWVILFPIVVLKLKGKSKLSKIGFIFFWLFIFILNVSIYFYDYKKPSHHPSFSEGLVHPLVSLRYFLSFLGSPLALGNQSSNLILAPIVGLILSISFLIILIYCVRQIFCSKNKYFIEKIAPWLSIGMYSLISALVTTSGRVGFGFEQALESRYTTFSLYFIISLFYLVILIYREIGNSLKNSPFIMFSLGIFFCLHILTFLQATNSMFETRESRLMGKSCLHFLNVLPGTESCITQKVFPVFDQLFERANAINSMGFLSPPLRKDNVVIKASKDNQQSELNYGFFDTLTKNGDGSYLAKGWATLPFENRPVDSVILGYEFENNKFKMFTLVIDVRYERSDVAKAFKNRKYLKSGWEKSFFLPQAIPNNTRLAAWGVDANTGDLFKLNGEHQIDR